MLPAAASAPLQVAGFSNTEEVAVGKDKAVPFLLEDRMKELGGDYVRGPDWHPFAGEITCCCRVCQSCSWAGATATSDWPPSSLLHLLRSPSPLPLHSCIW